MAREREGGDLKRYKLKQTANIQFPLSRNGVLYKSNKHNLIWVKWQLSVV